MTVQRPNPDELLERVQRLEERQARGRLKIFFGACAGVGKTFMMLAVARTQQAQGVDVLVGVVETHGRADTQAQLAGLEVLPRRQVPYRDGSLPEFDIDAALLRKPQLILMDELAHSNVAGSRHAKRWQDVEELRDAGIDVYTTVNVQHLESLNDIVGQITGIRVWETIPDRVFDEADEITLVDLPPDELLQRLKEGKVYLAAQAERAAGNFFRKGNLIALRELALRRTADRVDAQMRDYRADQSISNIWQARERLMVCVGPAPDSDKLIRSAARLAASLKADWIAVYIETPALQVLPDLQRERILKTLRLAQELGAETTTLAGPDICSMLLHYARSRNVSKLVVGKSARPMWLRFLRPGIGDQLTARNNDVDVYVVNHERVSDTAPPRYPAKTVSLEFAEARKLRRRGYVWAVLACIGVTLASSGLVNIFDLANVIMLYLLAVVLVAVRYGRGPGILASFLSVAGFDFFFVAPKWSFSVSDTQYLFTFVIMLAVALIISNLTSNQRYQARIANYRERRAQALFTMGKELSSALTLPQIIEIGTQHLSGVFQARIAFLVPDSHENVRQSMNEGSPAGVDVETDAGVAQWVYDHEQPAGLGTNTLPGTPALYVPLRAPMRTRGVLALVPDEPRLIFQPEQQRLLETFAGQIALAIERVHYVDVARDAIVSMEGERLRNSLLSAISHDLRTPLTSIVGLSSMLATQENLKPEARAELIDGIHEEALRMSGLVTNLLDMARLQAGGLTLNRQWQPIEEVVGSALRLMARPLQGHQVSVDLPPTLPLLSFDAILMERVLCNLLDNAVKYTPGGSHITISGRIVGDKLALTVEDDGPGLPPGMEERLFDKFTRGEKESAKPGVGLGLAICRAIVEAHQGRISAENNPNGGARFIVSLPLGEPPVVDDSNDIDATEEKLA